MWPSGVKDLRRQNKIIKSEENLKKPRSTRIEADGQKEQGKWLGRRNAETVKER